MEESAMTEAQRAEHEEKLRQKRIKDRAAAQQGTESLAAPQQELNVPGWLGCTPNVSPVQRAVQITDAADHCDEAIAEARRMISDAVTLVNKGIDSAAEARRLGRTVIQLVAPGEHTSAEEVQSSDPTSAGSTSPESTSTDPASESSPESCSKPAIEAFTQILDEWQDN